MHSNYKHVVCKNRPTISTVSVSSHSEAKLLQWKSATHIISPCHISTIRLQARVLFRPPALKQAILNSLVSTSSAQHWNSIVCIIWAPTASSHLNWWFPMLCLCWQGPADSRIWNWCRGLFRSASCWSCECWLPRPPAPPPAWTMNVKVRLQGVLLQHPCRLHVPLKVWQTLDHSTGCQPTIPW